jgi:hypothetical protein
MSETEITAAKERPAHLFKPGVSGNPTGRPKGARSKFSEAFIQDLHRVWEERGIAALEKCAAEQPGVFIRTCACLMPQNISLTLGVDPASFANNFATARALLGNPETPVLTVKPRVVGRKVASDRAG